MKIAIIGAGAMGSLFGALLSQKASVTLIDPYQAHIDAVNAEGLTVEHLDGTSRRYWIKAGSSPKSLDTPCELAVIFTKSHTTREAARTANALLKPDGLVLTLQNGLGNQDIIAASVNPDRVIVGVTAHGATLLGPGRIRHAGSGPTHLAELPSRQQFMQAVCTLFNNCGIAVSLSDDVDGLVWGKLIVNVGINALAAILRVPNGVLGARPACEQIMIQAVDEAVRVVEALGIRLPYADPVAQVRNVCKNTATNRASMLQDVLRGALTEIEVINQAIVEKGNALGIPTPVNGMLTAIVKALEETRDARCA